MTIGNGKFKLLLEIVMNFKQIYKTLKLFFTLIFHPIPFKVF
jgi:hypothetical protein